MGKSTGWSAPTRARPPAAYDGARLQQDSLYRANFDGSWSAAATSKRVTAALTREREGGHWFDLQTAKPGRPPVRLNLGKTPGALPQSGKTTAAPAHESSIVEEKEQRLALERALGAPAGVQLFYQRWLATGQLLFESGGAASSPPSDTTPVDDRQHPVEQFVSMLRDGKLVIDLQDLKRASERIRAAEAASQFDSIGLYSGILGGGAEKIVFTIDRCKDKVIGVMKDPRSAALDKQIDALNRLESLGFPVVRHYGAVKVDKQDALLMDYIEDAVLSSSIEVGCPNVNRRTIEDLSSIRRLLCELGGDEGFGILDFQFLVAPTGRVAIIDPMRLAPEERNANIALIDHVVDLCERTIALREADSAPQTH